MNVEEKVLHSSLYGATEETRPRGPIETIRHLIAQVRVNPYDKSVRAVLAD